MKIRTAIEKVLVSVVSISIAMMTLMAFWLVVARYFVTSQNPHLQTLVNLLPEGALRFTIFTTTITEELLRFALIWAGLIGATYVFSIKQHLAFGLLNELFSARLPRAGKGLNIVISLLIIGFSLLVLVWGGWIMVQKNMRQFSPILLLPMGYVYSILPISGVLTCILEFLNLCEIVTRTKSSVEQESDEVKIGPLD